MSKNYVIAALYCFVDIKAVAELRNDVLNKFENTSMRGTLLVAAEGINGSVAGTRAEVNNLLALLKSKIDLTNIEYKESFASYNPFLRFKVKLKQEIVTIARDEVNPCELVGEYVEPEAWNDLISDPEVMVLDTRNDYEIDIGTFKGAINPKTTNFREFPQYVNDNLQQHKQRKVAMFCTGGIRCEKASSYMLNAGFDKVYHLKGGILAYLAKIPKHQSLWQGECFVFDERVALDHNLDPGSFDQCYGCRHPITATDKESEHYVKGISCPKCYADTTLEQKSRFASRQSQIDIAKARGTKHLGVKVMMQQDKQSAS